MALPNPLRLLPTLLLAAVLAAGCDARAPAPGDDHDQDQDHDQEARSAPAAEGDDHGHDEDGHEHDDADADAGEGDAGHDHDEGEPDFAAILPADAGRHGIVMATAGPGPVAETLTLTGRVIMDPAHVALVRARFPGPVLAVTRSPGDPVQKGEVLARVESNESLSAYDVRSPIGGVVLERLTNVGDVAGTEPLYRIGNPERLLAELSAFPSQQSRVRRGAAVAVGLGSGAGAREIPGEVVALVPELEGHTQALRVRVALHFEGPPPAVPGQFVTARVSAGSSAAPVVVPAGAIQRLEGREVVFIPEDRGFRARPVEAGQRNADRVAITGGLASGERYVAEGAFLLKAEIGKNLAEHVH